MKWKRIPPPPIPSRLAFAAMGLLAIFLATATARASGVPRPLAARMRYLAQLQDDPQLSAMVDQVLTAETGGRFLELVAQAQRDLDDSGQKSKPLDELSLVEVDALAIQVALPFAKERFGSLDSSKEEGNTFVRNRTIPVCARKVRGQRWEFEPTNEDDLCDTGRFKSPRFVGVVLCRWQRSVFRLEATWIYRLVVDLEERKVVDHWWEGHRS